MPSSRSFGLAPHATRREWRAYVMAFVVLFVLMIVAAESLVRAGDLEINPDSPLAQLRGVERATQIERVVDAQSGAVTASTVQ